MRILVTGANGFIGNHLCAYLRMSGYGVRYVVKSVDNNRNYSLKKEDVITINDIGPDTNWDGYLHDIDTVVHLAGRAHILRETAKDALLAYRRVNVDGTKRLAINAVVSGVSRFIYVSSIGVNGEFTLATPFSEENMSNPYNEYAISKWEAEQELHKISNETGLEIIIIRPPLVYGPLVKGNFLTLLKIIDEGIPLPFGLINNRRSLIGVENLVDLIVQCINHPQAAGETFLASDNEDLSTPELIRRIAKAFGRKPRLIPFPPGLLEFSAKIIGQGGLVKKLLGSLQIDSSKARCLLGWEPRVSIDMEIQRTVDWYSQSRISGGS